LQRLKRAFDLPEETTDEALVATLTQFVRSLGLPTHLGELNLPLDKVDWAAIAEETMQMVMVHNNPRLVSAAECEMILMQMNQ
jgi:alcohol dehydrogenase class IV